MLSLASTISSKCPWANRKGRFNNGVIMNIHDIDRTFVAPYYAPRYFLCLFLHFLQWHKLQAFPSHVRGPLRFIHKNSRIVETPFPECRAGRSFFFSCKLYCAAEGGLIFFARAVPAAILCGWKGRQEPLNLL